MADMTYKVIQRVEGEDKVADLSAALSLAEQKLQALMEAERAAVKAGADWSVSVTSQASAVGNLQKELQGAQRELKNVKADFAQAATQAGYLADDLQQFQNGPAAGMRAISNNIQPLLQAIPGVGQFAAAISIGAIAVAQLYEHWDQLMGVFGQGKTKTEAEQMEELAKNTKRTADEEERYQKLKERAKHVEAQHQDSGQVSQFKKDVDDAIKNGPVSDIEKGIDKHYGQHIKIMADADQSDEAKAAREEYDRAKKDYDYSKKHNLPGALPGGALEKRLNDAQKGLDKLYADNRTKFMADLGGNPGMVAGLSERAEKNPGDFGPNGKQFAQDLKDAGKSPEAKRKEKDEADQDAKEEEILRKREEEWNNRRIKANLDAEDDEAKKDAKEEEELRKREEEWNSKRIKANMKAEEDMAKDREKAAKEQDKADKKAADLEDKEKVWANQDLIGQIDDRMGEIRAQKHTNSEITEGGASFASKIQSGVSSDSAKVQKDMLKNLEAIKDILQKRNENIQRDAARFS